MTEIILLKGVELVWTSGLRVTEEPAALLRERGIVAERTAEERLAVWTGRGDTAKVCSPWIGGKVEELWGHSLYHRW